MLLIEDRLNLISGCLQSLMNSVESIQFRRGQLYQSIIVARRDIIPRGLARDFQAGQNAEVLVDQVLQDVQEEVGLVLVILFYRLQFDLQQLKQNVLDLDHSLLVVVEENLVGQTDALVFNILGACHQIGLVLLIDALGHESVNFTHLELNKKQSVLDFLSLEGHVDCLAVGHRVIDQLSIIGKPSGD